MCRRKDCLFVWRSVDWIKGKEWNFRCPCCGEAYVPWSNEEEIWVKANMVWIAPTVEVSHGAVGGVHLGHDDAGTWCHVMPLLWKDSSTQELRTTIEGAVQEVANTMTGLPPDQRMVFALDLARRAVVPEDLSH